MSKNLKEQRKLFAIIIIVVAILIIITMLVVKLNGKKSKEVNTAEKVDNYEVTTAGTKINTSEEVSTNKIVSGVLLEKSKIAYENGISKLTSKVTNDGTEKTNLRFTIKFIGNDGSVIGESVGYVGPIKANEVRYIDSSVIADVSNAKTVEYEIIK